jgi:hypothetical protein
MSMFNKGIVQAWFPTIVGIIIVLVIGGGILVYQYYYIAENTIGPSPEIQIGVIEGSLGYPSDLIPPDMKVCAENKQTGEKYCTKEHIKDKKYVCGEGYKIEVPPGDYFVYANLPSEEDYKAYYSEFVTCGLNVKCFSHEPILVSIEEGDNITDIDPIDWYVVRQEQGGGITDWRTYVHDQYPDNSYSSQFSIKIPSNAITESYIAGVFVKFPDSGMFTIWVNGPIYFGQDLKDWLEKKDKEDSTYTYDLQAIKFTPYDGYYSLTSYHHSSGSGKQKEIYFSIGDKLISATIPRETQWADIKTLKEVLGTFKF